MTLICVPRGRGRWSRVTMRITGRRADPLMVRRNSTFELAGIVWRVVEVRP